VNVHCKVCWDVRPPDVNIRDHARLEVDVEGTQATVRCLRHDRVVVVLELAEAFEETAARFLEEGRFD
jgi:hypothetical protein